MATKAQDTFTEGADTNLTDHTPDTGTGWTTDLLSESSMQIIAADDELDVATGIASSQGAREDTDIGDDDMDVSLTSRTNLGSFQKTRSGVAARIPSGTFDSANGYVMTLETKIISSNRIYRLFKVISNTPTDIGSFDDGVGSTDGLVFKLEIRTAAKKLFVDGVERISSTDDSLTGNNFAGFLTESSTDVAMRWDDFLSEDVAAAAANQLTGSLASSGVGW